MQRRAAVGRAELGLQRIERLQPEDAPRVESVGIAPPLLDARDREPRRPRLERRRRLGTRPRLVGVGPVERVGPGEVAAPAALDVFRRRRGAARLVAEQRVEPRQPARRHGRRAALALGAGQQHALGAQRRGKVVRRQADAALRLRQAERGAHRPVDPRAGLDRRRPGALVQAAQHQKVGALQARFERSPDGEARMAAEARADDLGLEHGREQRRPFAAGDRGLAGPRRAQAGEGVGQRFAGLAVTTASRPRRCVSAAAMRGVEQGVGRGAGCHQRGKRRRRGVEPVDQVATARRSAGSPNLAASMRARIAAMPGVGLQAAQALAVEPSRGIEQRRAIAAQRAQRMLQQARAGRPARSRRRRRRPARAAARPAACRPAARRPRSSMSTVPAPAARRRRGAPGRGRA